MEASSDLGNFTGACPCSMDYDAPDVYNRAIRKSRKEYKCIECGAVIPKGRASTMATGTPTEPVCLA